MFSVAPFSLNDSVGQAVGFPGTRPSLVCFIKEDCPTCRVVMPFLAAMHESFSEKMDFYVIGQTAVGNQQLMDEIQPPFNILDDSTLKVSFNTDIETVPTLLLTDAKGLSKPLASRCERTNSRVSSRRGWMMPTSKERGT